VLVLRALPTLVDAVVAEVAIRPTVIEVAVGVAVDKQLIVEGGEDVVEPLGVSHALNAASLDTLQILVRSGSVRGSWSDSLDAGYSHETYNNESW